MLFALLLAAAPAQATLPPYAESIRCAGLAEASTRIGPRKPNDAGFDTALYWGLAASEAARKNGIPAERFTADQVAAADKAEAELRDPRSDAPMELAFCVARVPRTAPDRKGERG
ncbi:MAG TPA: hypothetical protein VF655_07010 [Allosphingosinicella sp.]